MYIYVIYMCTCMRVIYVVCQEVCLDCKVCTHFFFLQFLKINIDSTFAGNSLLATAPLETSQYWPTYIVDDGIRI